MRPQTPHRNHGLFYHPLKTFSVFACIFLIFPAGDLWAKPPYLVMPYVQTGDSGTVTPAGIPWNDITHLNEAFGKVKATSPFASFNQPAAWSTMVATAHTNNTRVNISFGGAGTSDTTWSTATNSTNLANFESQIMGVVSANNFDGVDIDWEFPQQQVAGDGTQFMTLLSDLATQLHALSGYDSQPKTLTFYISPGAYICGVDWAAAATIVDYGIQGGYDYNVTAAGAVYNGPVSLPNAAGVSFTDCFGIQRPLDSSSNIATIVSKGWALDKTILGCPFYIENGSESTLYTVLSGGTLVSSATGTLEMESVYTYPSSGGSNYGVNDRDAFCAKINWAVGQMGMPGISMWELGNAYPATDAPVSAVWNVIGGNDACVTVNTPTPTNTTHPSSTPTNSPTISNTPTITNSPTPSFTGTFTNTRTSTNSPTDTSTSSFTFTFTLTSTPTDSMTPSSTSTGTLSPSDTPSFTSTFSLTPSPTPTSTSTSSFTSTSTSSLTVTPTWTGTSSFTGTPTNIPTPTNSFSPVPTPIGLPVLFPNPISGPGPVMLRLSLTTEDQVDIKFFTTAFRKVNEYQTPPLPPGTYDLPLALTDNWGTALANGVYYVVVTTSDGTYKLKLLIIR